MDNYMIVISTRSQDGQTKDDISLYEAIETFMASDGYRLGFTLPDGRSLYIHRSDEDLSKTEPSKIDHPVFNRFSKYESFVLIEGQTQQENIPDNVYNISQYKSKTKG